MIKVEGLTKRYGRNVAVDHISFEVPKGEIVAFLGPNGAGKTTTMRILTCYLPATSGAANVAGFDVQREPLEVKKRIGYLPENPPLYPELGVAEYLAFVGKLKGIRRADLPKRVDEACERCAISDVRKKLIGTLSKGYRQRVGLAQAIIHNPDVLILDEPTSGLDPQQIIETRGLIKKMAGDHTILLSTHILPAVEQTCNQAIIIHKGKLIAYEPLETLAHRVRGAEATELEVSSPAGALDTGQARRRLEQVAGVSRVLLKESRNGLAVLEVESLQGRSVRSELARAVLDAGWNLHNLRPAEWSLEQVFLQLTGRAQREISGEQQ